jgi:hypothetical protein
MSNASLTALNLAKYQAYHSRSSTSLFVFSMASFKRLEFNHHLLLTFIDKLDLYQFTMKIHQIQAKNRRGEI